MARCANKAAKKARQRSAKYGPEKLLLAQTTPEKQVAFKKDPTDSIQLLTKSPQDGTQIKTSTSEAAPQSSIAEASLQSSTAEAALQSSTAEAALQSPTAEEALENSVEAAHKTSEEAAFKTSEEAVPKTSEEAPLKPDTMCSSKKRPPMSPSA